MCNNYSDPFVEFARNLKYNLVKIPCGNIHPLDVLLLYPNAGLKRYCSLPKMVFPNITSDGGTFLPPVPNVIESNATNFSGQFSGKVGIDIGLDFLKNVLNMFGATSAGLGLAIGTAKQLQFQFENVKIQSVELYDLSRYMLKAVPDTSVNILLMDRKGEAFVITDVLRSNSIDIKVFDQSGSELKLDIDAIKGVVGANVSVSQERASDLKVSFKGTEDLTFAFKAAAFWVEVEGLRRAKIVLDLPTAPSPDNILYLFGPNLQVEDELTTVLFAPSFIEVNDEAVESIADVAALQAVI